MGCGERCGQSRKAVGTKRDEAETKNRDLFTPTRAPPYTSSRRGGASPSASRGSRGPPLYPRRRRSRSPREGEEEAAAAAASLPSPSPPLPRRRRCRSFLPLRPQALRLRPRRRGSTAAAARSPRAPRTGRSPTGAARRPAGRGRRRTAWPSADFSLFFLFPFFLSLSSLSLSLSL